MRPLAPARPFVWCLFILIRQIAPPPLTWTCVTCWMHMGAPLSMMLHMHCFIQIPPIGVYAVKHIVCMLLNVVLVYEGECF